MAKENENKKQTDSFFEIIKEAKKARMEYEAKMAAIRDKMTRLHVAEQKGREEGRMEGIINVAKNLIALGADMSMIIKATGLNEDEIRKIKEEMENFKQ
ncbi:hypothetical protein [Caloramator australicus]|uniref:Signal transduction histidine kinase n=1 Tax=Caloramator australicus RC3 TaxID=857293 RepID=I7LIA8_9CLOT|nr:hypothetical protein [Caloramator australicus]CCJ34703.1 Conserved hypothetical protein 1784 [Caloramator australicus RC3]